MAMLSVEQLSSGYGKLPILDQVSLQVQPGEVVAVIGPNGAGKSTLLKTISGLLRSSSGRILFDGQSLEGSPPHAVTRCGLSYVPEGGRLARKRLRGAISIASSPVHISIPRCS